MSNDDYKLASLILSKALGFLLEEGEGVVIVPENDIEKMLGSNRPLAIFNKDGQIRVQPVDPEIPDGQMIWMHDKDSNEEVQ